MRKKVLVGLLVAFVLSLVAMPIAQGGVIMHDGVELAPSGTATQYNITQRIDVGTIEINTTSLIFTSPDISVTIQSNVTNSTYIDLQTLTNTQVKWNETAQPNTKVNYTFNFDVPNKYFGLYRDNSKLNTFITNKKGLITFSTTLHSTHSYELSEEKPKVASTIPIDGGGNVTIDNDVEITFNQKMNTSKEPTLEGGSVSYSFQGWKDNYTAIWSHPDWEFDSTLTLTVSNYENAGGTTGNPYEWSFETEVHGNYITRLTAPIILIIVPIVVVIVIIKILSSLTIDEDDNYDNYD